MSIYISDGSFQTPKANSHNESLEILRPPGSAINDTNKVNKTKRRVPRPEPPGHNTSSNFSLNDLRKVGFNLNPLADTHVKKVRPIYF